MGDCCQLQLQLQMAVIFADVLGAETSTQSEHPERDL